MQLPVFYLVNAMLLQSSLYFVFLVLYFVCVGFLLLFFGSLFLSFGSIFVCVGFYFCLVVVMGRFCAPVLVVCLGLWKCHQPLQALKMFSYSKKLGLKVGIV